MLAQAQGKCNQTAKFFEAFTCPQHAPLLGLQGLSKNSLCSRVPDTQSRVKLRELQLDSSKLSPVTPVLLLVTKRIKGDMRQWEPNQRKAAKGEQWCKISNRSWKSQIS